MEPTGSSLEDIIAGTFCYSVFPEGTNARFIPAGCAETLFTEPSVTSELYSEEILEISNPSRASNDAHTRTFDDELINYVVTSAKKLFIISIISGVTSTKLRSAMLVFKKQCFGDKDLPILEADVILYPSCFVNKRPWTNLTKENFKRDQWGLMLPVFSVDFMRSELRAEAILPFIRVASERKEGTFGAVHQVTIHPAHQKKPMRKVRVLTHKKDLQLQI